MILSRVLRLGPLVVCVAAAACGMKGPPLPPLQRVPAAATDVVPQRFDADVYVSFVVPRANVEGEGPASIARVEVYAITLEAPLGAAEAQTAAVRQAATLVAAEPVRLPPPPPDPDAPDAPPPPVEPGLDQGATAVVHERLTDETRVPVTLQVASPLPAAAAPEVPVPSAAPTIGPGDSALPRRYYFVVGVRADGRYGRASALVGLPLEPTTGATSAPVITYDERTMTVRWTPPADAHPAPEPLGDLLASTPLFPPPPPTRYDVYAIPSTPAAAEAAVPRMPDPLNEAPLTATELAVPGVDFGTRRCFAVRTVDEIAGVVVRGPLSEPACETPRDTFAPAAPQGLAAVSGAGSISLIWDPNAEADLAGYLVLRGEAGGTDLVPLTPAPIRETTFRDTNVTPGTRYVYAIVAVDGASPANASEPSARVEEAARQ